MCFDHQCVSSGEMAIEDFSPYFDWVVCFFNIELHKLILEINPLMFTSFASIFSHSLGCLLILCMVSFAVQILLSLTRSHLFIFVFISITLGGGS